MRKNKPKKEGIYKLTAVVLAALLSIMSSGTVAKAEGETKDYGVSNPQIAYVNRETVIFGNYWQDTGWHGDYSLEHIKQPITWQILEKYEDGTALLLSDRILYPIAYNTNKNEIENNFSCTWETSSVRTWLNGTSEGDFLYDAFSEKEQEAILVEKLTNDDNPVYGTEGGNDTQDKVFLLSLDDIKNVKYGFRDNIDLKDEARITEVTPYVGGGMRSGYWWLRSPGYSSNSAAVVDSNGGIISYEVNYIDGIGVRPAIRVNLSSPYIKNGNSIKVSVKGSEWNTIIFGKYNNKDIVWRVLYNSGDDAFLLSDKILLNEYFFNKDDPSPTWKDSSLRKWLNEDFYNDSFNDVEKNMIKSVNVINEDNPYTGTKGGENTVDKIYLLSFKDIVNPSYGFSDLIDISSANRVSKDSDGRDDYWWLRTIGNHATFVDAWGKVNMYGADSVSYIGVRPCLHIDLSSSAWKKGETIIYGDPTGGTEIPLDPNSRTDFSIDNTKKGTTESNQTTETKNPKQPVDSKPTPQEAYKNAGAGVGKISSDGKKLVDTDNKTWQMSNKLENKDLKKNLNVAVKNGGKYKITKVTKKGGKVTGGTVTYMAPYDKNCKLISATGIVKLAGVNFKVTQIAPKCAKGCKKLKKVVIGSYVTTIGANAFSGCSSLATVTIKKGSLTSIGAKAFYNCKKLNNFSITGLKLKKVGSNAFKNTNSKITFKCPKSKLKNYEKLFTKAGASKKAKYTK